MKQATAKELGIENVPCSFEIKYVAADSAEDYGSLAWYAYAQKPVYDTETEEWVLSLDGCGGYYELGVYMDDYDGPDIYKGLDAETSLFEVVEEDDNE